MDGKIAIAIGNRFIITDNKNVENIKLRATRVTVLVDGFLYLIMRGLRDKDIATISEHVNTSVHAFNVYECAVF